VEYLVRMGADVRAQVGGKDSFYFASARGLHNIIPVLKKGVEGGGQSRSSFEDLLGKDDDDDGWAEPEIDQAEQEKEKERKRLDSVNLFKQRMSSVVLEDEDEW